MMANEPDKDVDMKDATPIPNPPEQVTSQSEDHLTSGFAKHSEKEKIIEVFHRRVWPALAELKWTKVRPFRRSSLPTSSVNEYVAGLLDHHPHLDF